MIYKIYQHISTCMIFFYLLYIAHNGEDISERQKGLNEKKTRYSEHFKNAYKVLIKYL